MRMPHAPAFVLLACLAACVVSGCGPREAQIERAIERELPRIVGPAERYDVDVTGVRRNREADRVAATGIRVQPAGSPVLDRVEIILLNVVYDPNRGQLVRIGQADGTVRVLDRDIALFLEQNRDLQDVQVRLEPPNRAVVSAQPVIPQLQLPPGAARVEVAGTLRGEGQFIEYSVTQVRAAGLTLPDPAPRLLSDEINPIVDLSGIPVVLQVVAVRVEGNAVIAEVTGRYPSP